VNDYFLNTLSQGNKLFLRRTFSKHRFKAGQKLQSNPFSGALD